MNEYLEKVKPSLTMSSKSFDEFMQTRDRISNKRKNAFSWIVFVIVFVIFIFSAFAL